MFCDKQLFDTPHSCDHYMLIPEIKIITDVNENHLEVVKYLLLSRERKKERKKRLIASDSAKNIVYHLN